MRSVSRLLVVALLLAGCGGGDDEAAERPAAAAATPFPTIDFTGLTAGATYVTKTFTPRLQLTLPEGGWIAASGDKADHVEIELEDPEDPVDNSGMGFHHMTKVFPPEQGGELPGDAVDGPADFAAWLTSHPHLKTTKPEPVSALGLKGVSVDIRVKSSQPRLYRDCGKYEGDCVVLYMGGIEPYVYGSDVQGRFLVLEQPGGGQLVVEQWVEPRRAFDDQVKIWDQVLAGTKLAD